MLMGFLSWTLVVRPSIGGSLVRGPGTRTGSRTGARAGTGSVRPRCRANSQVVAAVEVGDPT
ncbi:hypothetical protein GCM10009859_21240 [Kocuria salsicia]